jgi:cobalt-zinc-cadmium efflux system membrane fusion protein
VNRTSGCVLGLSLVCLLACRPAEPEASPPTGTPAAVAVKESDAARKAGAGDSSEVRVAEPKHDEHEELPSTVRLTAEAKKDARLRMEPVVREPLARTMDLTGEVVADPDAVARVSARAAGRVVEVRFREGDTVRKDAVLAVLESPELARARAAWTVEDARSRNARSNADRLAEVARQGLVSAQAAQGAEAEALALAAEAHAAQQLLGSFGVGTQPVPAELAARLEVRAPMGGVVVARSAVVGEAVAAGAVLGTVVNLQKAYFHARLFERNLSAVEVGRPAEVLLNAHPGQPLQGVVESVGHQVDPVARTVVARIALRNAGGLLRLGLFGTAHVVLASADRGRAVLTVPASAVTRLGKEDVVFVAQPDGQFEVHPVTLGGRAAGRVEMLSGVREGELVVAEGVFSLKSLVLKSTFGEEE